MAASMTRASSRAFGTFGAVFFVATHIFALMAFFVFCCCAAFELNSNLLDQTLLSQLDFYGAAYSFAYKQ